MKIIQNLWQVGGGGLTDPADAAVYLVRFGQQAALIDAGCGRDHQRLVDNIALVLPSTVEIPYLFLTHCHYDHVGGASALREQYRCQIVAHQLDATFLETADNQVTAASWYGAKMRGLPIDYKIQGHKEKIRVGDGEVRAYHCPGHSPGSLVYLVELENQRVLFGQDVHGPLHPSLLSNSKDYRRSLAFMLGLKADILCEGHFGVFKGRKNIEKFVRSYMVAEH
ncbi:MAG: MBL fold metallo-hydrolase [Desulfobacterales bacterium]|jgi:glyoxylase-like metal-dependent hydrolase (beta-lactamase superfamily II)